MAAVSFHLVEQSLKRKGKIYDFNYFLYARRNSTKKVRLEQLEEISFYEWKHHSFQNKLKKLNPRTYLNSIAHGIFKKAERIFSYANTHGGQFNIVNFLNYTSLNII